MTHLDSVREVNHEWSANGSDVIGRGIRRGESVVGDRTNARIILESVGDGKYHILTAFPE